MYDINKYVGFKSNNVFTLRHPLAALFSGKAGTYRFAVKTGKKAIMFQGGDGVAAFLDLTMAAVLLRKRTKTTACKVVDMTNTLQKPFENIQIFQD